MPRPTRTTAPFLALGVIFALAASAHAHPVKVVVSIPPLRGLIAPIAVAADDPASPDAKSTVTTLIPPGRSEHGYEIPPAKLDQLLAADIVVLVGLGLEPQVDKFLNSHPDARPEGSRRRLIRFSDITGIAASHEDEEDHDHDAAHEHHHAVDPHLWLDPVLVEKLVAEVTAEVAARAGADPETAGRVRAAGDAVLARVRVVHEAYQKQCAAFPVKTIVVGHDAWRRLADRYGLKTIAIAGLAATEPTPGALERAAQAVRDNSLKIIFVEPQLSDRAGGTIAARTGAEVRRLDPLGDGDWFAMMAANLREIGAALAPPTPPAQTK